MRLALCVVFLLAAYQSTVAGAVDCRDEVASSALNGCFSQQFRDADKILNQKFALILKCVAHPAINSSSEGSKRLISAQRNWIKYRDAECVFRVGAANEGGTMQPMESAICLKALTEQRIADFDKYIKCSSSDNDPDCPTRGCDLNKSEATPNP